MSADLMKSKFVRPFVRPWHRLSLKLLHGFLSNFSCCFPCAIPLDIFRNFEKRGDFLRIFFVFVNIGSYGSENFKTLLILHIAVESFQTFPEFLSNGPYKITYGIFEIFQN